MKRELLRVTAGSDALGLSAVVPDLDGAATGRGAHLHPTVECYELAVRRKAFARALRFSGASGVGLTSTPLAEHLASQDPRP